MTIRRRMLREAQERQDNDRMERFAEAITRGQRAENGWNSSTSAWRQVLNHPAVQVELNATRGSDDWSDISLLEATLRALDKVPVEE